MTDKLKMVPNGDRAFAMYNEIKQRRHETSLTFLRLGELFRTIRDEELYTFFSCDSFEEFMALPDLGFARSTVFLFIEAFEVYVEKLGFDKESIAEVEISKLQIITPIVRERPEEAGEWLLKARELSRSDLKDEVREARCLPPTRIRQKVEDTVDLGLYDDYLAFVRGHKCCVCNTEHGIDAHHFPVTSGAGAEDYKRIPLCRECHTLCHTDPHDFMWTYKEKIFDYFYDIVMSAYSKLSG